MAQTTTDKIDINNIFLRAFKDCASGIINDLSTEANDPATVTAVQTIVSQLNFNFARLSFVIDAIQDRVYYDPTWTEAAVSVYDTLATFIDPAFVHPDFSIQGALLVQHQLMKVLQAQFTSMVAADTWSPGFTNFLAQLCRTDDSIGNLTPGIMLHIVSGMVESGKLFNGGNLDLLFEVVCAAGPVLDSQALGIVNGLSNRLQRLQERVNERGQVMSMAVFGLLELRKMGWSSKTL